MALDHSHGHACSDESSHHRRPRLARANDNCIESRAHMRLYVAKSGRCVPVRHVDCCHAAVIAAVNIIALLPCRRHRSQRIFSKGVLSVAARDFGSVPPACDPIRSATQVDGGRINRLSHWTIPT